MKKLLIILVYLPISLFASFPVSKSMVLNSEPSTDSWIPLIIFFWLLLIMIPIILIRFIIKKINIKK